MPKIIREVKKINSKTISVRNKNYKIVTGLINSKNKRSVKRQWFQMCIFTFSLFLSLCHMSLSFHLCLSFHVSLCSHFYLFLCSSLFPSLSSPSQLFFLYSLTVFTRSVGSLSVRKNLTCPESQGTRALAHPSNGKLLAPPRKNLYRCSVVWCGVLC